MFDDQRGEVAQNIIASRNLFWTPWRETTVPVGKSMQGSVWTDRSWVSLHSICAKIHCTGGLRSHTRLGPGAIHGDACLVLPPQWRRGMVDLSFGNNVDNCHH